MDGVEFGSLQECVERGRERDILLTACDTKVPLVIVKVFIFNLNFS